MKKIFLILLVGYKKIISPLFENVMPSAFLNNNCRFYPSCSTYMYEEVEKNGFAGFLSGIKRTLKCNPFFD